MEILKGYLNNWALVPVPDSSKYVILGDIIDIDGDVITIRTSQVVNILNGILTTLNSTYVLGKWVPYSFYEELMKE